jgi:preprotein translocase subunit SecA
LFVLGTERHKARRIDNQLRGRSGRQGDPGATQFFVSLEDSLMRIFASDTIKRLLGRFGIPEDEPIENGLITRSLESAQTKIEGLHFDARKHTLEYDDVLNFQRKIVYARRHAILISTGDELKKQLEEYLELESVNEETKKQLQLEKDRLGEGQFYISLRQLVLQTIDSYWIDHLEIMEYTRQSVNLRAYGQRDPLVEYKKEGLRLFKEMQAGIIAQVISLVTTLNVNLLQEEERKMRAVQKQAQLIGGATNTEQSSGQPVAVRVSVSAPSGEKTNRNERVIITKNGEEKEIKFKKLEEFTKDGWSLKN